VADGHAGRIKMRVTTLIPDVEYSVQQSQQNLSTALQQLSTGLRVNEPSDDPTASANMVISLAASANVDQYVTNVSSVSAQLQTADGAIAAITTDLNTTISLATSAPTAAISDANRAAVATQVEGLLTSVIAQANSSYQGNYIFAGSATGTPPFVAASTTYTSQNGSVGSPLTATSPLQAGSVTTVNDAATGQTFTYTAAAGDTIGTLEQAISAAVATGNLSPGTGTTIDSNGNFAISSAAGLVASSTDSTLGSLGAAPGSTLANAYAYVGNSTVNTVRIGDFHSVATNVPGNQLFTSGTNLIGSLTTLITALQNGNSEDISTASYGITSALNSLSQQRVPMDSTIGQLSDQDSYLSQETLTLTTHQSDLIDIGLATAATNLSKAELDNSAVLAAASKVLPQTLLNYLAPG
jgi:flagellar hook-associated protein 3